MKIKINESRAVGVALAPPSKSLSHRMIIAAALADGESTLYNVSTCEDCLATIDCLRAMGAKIDFTDDGTLRIIAVYKRIN